MANGNVLGRAEGQSKQLQKHQKNETKDGNSVGEREKPGNDGDPVEAAAATGIGLTARHGRPRVIASLLFVFVLFFFRPVDAATRLCYWAKRPMTRTDCRSSPSSSGNPRPLL